MTKKHKYYDVIVAWANGEDIQYSSIDLPWKDYEPYAENSVPAFNYNEFSWRIKPKTTIKRCRMALFTDGMVVAYDITNSTLDDPIEYKLCGFIRWVGDTVEVELDCN